jgi:hypothetical protein
VKLGSRRVDRSSFLATNQHEGNDSRFTVLPIVF